MPRKKAGLTSIEDSLQYVIRDLKSKAKHVDPVAAAAIPEWAPDERVLKANPQFARADMARLSGYYLYAIEAKAEKLVGRWKNMPRWSYTLVDPRGEMIGGGETHTFEQAREYAIKAFQATQGIIIGGDA